MLALQLQLNSNRKKHSQPVRLPMPWDGHAKAETVTPEERDALRAELLERSAMRDL